MKISSTSMLGLLIGLAIGVIATRRVGLPSDLQATMMVHEYAWSIVVSGCSFLWLTI